jgi:hypothetical protein
LDQVSCPLSRIHGKLPLKSKTFHQPDMEISAGSRSDELSSPAVGISQNSPMTTSANRTAQCPVAEATRAPSGVLGRAPGEAGAWSGVSGEPPFAVTVVIGATPSEGGGY